MGSRDIDFILLCFVDCTEASAEAAIEMGEQLNAHPIIYIEGDCTQS